MALVVHPVAAGAAVSLRLVQEPQRNPCEPVDSALGVGFAGGDHKHAGHIVGAVAVLGARLGQTGVLEGAASIRQMQQMVEARRLRGHGHTKAAR